MKLAGRGRRFSQLTDLPDRGRRGLAALARDAEAYGISAAKRQVQENGAIYGQQRCEVICS
jgi:hypothetical protein